MTPAEPRFWPTVGVMALAFGVLSLAVAASWSPLMRLDEWMSVRAFAATYGHDSRTATWSAITDWGGPGPMRWLLIAAGVVALVLRRWWSGGWLVALSALEGVAAPLAKDVFDRPRPVWPEPIETLASTSYPSGHAAAATAAAVGIALVVRRTVVTWVCLGGAVAVSVSRVFLGAHYPSDIVGGMLFGALLAMTTYGLVLRLRPRERELVAD